MADAIDLEPLRTLQTQGFTGGIIDYLHMEISGFGIPGVLKHWVIPPVKFETVDTEGGIQTRIPTLNVEPVIAKFITVINHPAIGALLVRTPAIRFTSKKSRMSLTDKSSRYEDGIEIIGKWIGGERAPQEYKGLDTEEIQISIHTFLHKYGDGIKTFECAYLKAQPSTLRLHGKEFLGAQNEKSLITW